MPKPIQQPKRKLTAQLMISRYSGTNEGISLRIIDEASGVEFVSLDLTMAQFASALTARVETGIPMEVRGLDVVGARSENKTVEVAFANKVYESGMDADTKPRSKQVREALAPHEVDGWSGRASDLFNNHRLVRDQNPKAPSRYNVTFRRFVDAVTGEPIPLSP